MDVGAGEKLLLAVLCILAGAAALSYGFISNDLERFSYTVIIAVAYLAITLLARRRESNLRRFWELSFAFFVLAFVQVLNNLSRSFGAYVLHQPPVPGDPLASTVSGSVVVQLVETLVAIVPILVLTKAAGMPLRTVYARKGKLRGWFVVAIAIFVLFYIAAARGGTSGFIPTRGPVPLGNFLALTPTLLVMVISNGFQEEFLFRGLFLQKYGSFFGESATILLSSIVFAIAHLGVTYTASAIIFTLISAFPLGLVTAYLMQKTNGVITPAILHAGFDIPIYWAFLTFVS
jgi:membrane protease YdiL (CAAX protease family)